MTEYAAETTVLLVEDDARLARLTTAYLESHGLIVSWVSDGPGALAEVERLKPDIVLLDLMLPGLDGVEVCHRLRQKSDIPIIMLTARTEEADRVLGLEGGADDYVSKPFSSRELLARVRAQVRRSQGKAGPAPERLDLGRLVVDASRMQVHLDGKPVELTTNEFRLLQALAERAGRVLAREQLLRLVHGNAEDAFDRSIDVHVSRLRQKLEADPRKPTLLKTVRGAGYLLVADEG